MKNAKTLTIQEYELPILIKEQPEGGFLASCPKWQDCYAQADTIEEAINEISYVASSLIELYKEEELPIPLKLKKTSQKSALNLTFKFPLVVSN